MGWHHASVTYSVNMGVHYASVLGRKGNSLLRGGAPRKQQRHNDGNKRPHAVNVPLLWRSSPRWRTAFVFSRVPQTVMYQTKDGILVDRRQLFPNPTPEAYPPVIRPMAAALKIVTDVKLLFTAGGSRC
jgi:hypothetical protein